MKSISWLAAGFCLGAVAAVGGVLGSGVYSQMPLSVHVDHLTGCEYLESSRGFLTLRRDRNLKPVCVAPG